VRIEKGAAAAKGARAPGTGGRKASAGEGVLLSKRVEATTAAAVGRIQHRFTMFGVWGCL